MTIINELKKRSENPSDDVKIEFDGILWGECEEFRSFEIIFLVVYYFLRNFRRELFFRFLGLGLFCGDNLEKECQRFNLVSI